LEKKRVVGELRKKGELISKAKNDVESGQRALGILRKKEEGRLEVLRKKLSEVNLKEVQVSKMKATEEKGLGLLREKEESMREREKDERRRLGLLREKEIFVEVKKGELEKLSLEKKKLIEQMKRKEELMNKKGESLDRAGARAKKGKSILDRRKQEGVEKLKNLKKKLMAVKLKEVKVSRMKATEERRLSLLKEREKRSAFELKKERWNRLEELKKKSRKYFEEVEGHKIDIREAENVLGRKKLELENMREKRARFLRDSETKISLLKKEFHIKKERERDLIREEFAEKAHKDVEKELKLRERVIRERMNEEFDLKLRQKIQEHDEELKKKKIEIGISMQEKMKQLLS
jgi:hypothetical protein